MTRLTVSNKLFPSGEQMLKGYSDKYVQAMANKLSNLEDIEDELGIELITLYKALKKGIYIKNQSQTTYPLALLRTHYSNNTARYYVFDNGKEKEIKLNKYGKTWALTKEELL